MRNMTDNRSTTIMLGYIQGGKIGPSQLYQLTNLVVDFCWHIILFHNYIAFVLKQILFGRSHTAHFPTSHRMAWHIINIVWQDFLKLIPDILLGTAGICNHCSRLNKGQQLLHHRHHLQYRGTQENNICFLYHLLWIARGKIHRPQFHSLVHRGLSPTHTSNVYFIP